MGLIFLAIELLVILAIENKVKLRKKYQRFAQRFTGYYIDFIALIIVWMFLFGFLYALSLTVIPDSIIKHIAGLLFFYSLLVILPMKFIDELMIKVFR